jgi:hypothetical protein
MSRTEALAVANVMWFVSALYFIAGPAVAYYAALIGFGLVAAGCSYGAFREGVVQSVRRRARR